MFEQFTETLSSLQHPNNLIYADGSYDSGDGRAGCAFVSNEITTLKDSNGVAPLHSELRHALTIPDPKVYILTESLSAMHTLQNSHPVYNLSLTATIFRPIKGMAEQGKSMSFAYITNITEMIAAFSSAKWRE